MKNLYMSILLEDATTAEDVVQIINSGDVCEGIEGIEFTAEQLAGEYAFNAAKQSDYGAEECKLEAHLEFIRDLGADFDLESALDHAMLFVSACVDE